MDEADIGEARRGQSSSFTVDAFREQTFAAVVNEVRNAPQTLSNVVTYDVVLDVDNLDQKLRPGMTANVPIKLGVSDGTMTEVEGLAVGRAVVIDAVRYKSRGTSSSAAGSGRGL